MADNNVEFSEELDSSLDATQTEHFSEAVLHSADWTVETMVSQLTRGNIEMNPRFQRRDAWSLPRKSTFIESLILGLPVPQIVLAEKQGQRGKYIVLDGKQRLLSLLQFTGNSGGAHNAFRLTGLEARTELNRKNFEELKSPAFDSYFDAFMNYTVRTVVIRNWPSHDFLHLVFLRLNTGSVKLSPQELRQAMFPGEFSNYVDDYATVSKPLQALLGRDSADPRMRDVELLVRFLGFHFFLPEYSGRMKDFLDYTCGRLNSCWDTKSTEIQESMAEFDLATELLIQTFEANGVARKENSKSFNRAIFDALVFYAANKTIRNAIAGKPSEVRKAYEAIVAERAFLDASESDTAGIPNTYMRLHMWGERLRDTIGVDFNLPILRPADPANQSVSARIVFDGFGV